MKVTVELGLVTEKNINNMSEIVKATFPVKYEADFFPSLDRSLCHFGYVSDFLVSTVACRKEGGQLYVLALATLKAYRGRGFASALLTWAETQAKALGCAEILLHVRASDEQVQRFYKQRGFEVKERVLNYYPMTDDSDALLLHKLVENP
jgi:ribosomal protein S18 acetylase RimI-like enzyme